MEYIREAAAISQQYPLGAVLLALVIVALVIRGTPAGDAFAALFNKGFVTWWQSSIKRAEERDRVRLEAERMRIEAERARYEVELESRRAESNILRQAANLLNDPNVLAGRGDPARVTGQHKTVDRDHPPISDDGKDEG